MKKILTFAVAIGFLITSCDTKKKMANGKQNETSGAAVSTTSTGDIPYTEAKNYFVKNTYKDGQMTSPKITSKADFDQIFGMAATMATNGKPTDIDFTRQYVLAVIGTVTDKSTFLTASSLKQTGHIITLTYHQTEGEKQSAFIRPLLLLVVDNQYQGDVELVRD